VGWSLLFLTRGIFLGSWSKKVGKWPLLVNKSGQRFGLILYTIVYILGLFCPKIAYFGLKISFVVKCPLFFLIFIKIEKYIL
jgi:hypothetical protein